MEKLFGPNVRLIGRRAVLGGAAALAANVVLPAAARQRASAPGRPVFAYVGSYTGASKPRAMEKASPSCAWKQARAR